MNDNIHTIFSPRSIAIVGASREVGRIGHDVLKNLQDSGFIGSLYPINIKADGDILGLPSFPSLTAVGAPIDLVVVAIPAKGVAAVLREAGSLKIPGAVVITAGFKEAGNPEGEAELRSIAEENKIALVGPNCLGVISCVSNMNASFAASMPRTGTVGFLSQSGAVCTAMLDGAERYGIGFSHFVSLGNKAVIDETAILEYFLNDPATKVIGMYVEDVARPQALVELLRRAHTNGTLKPVVVLKSGRTEMGAKAGASHTGALAGKDEAYDALFTQAGIFRADRMSDFVDTLRVFAQNPIPSGTSVGIITNAGGPGVLATDAVVRAGLTAPELSSSTQAALAEHLPAAASTRNPVDLLGDANAVRYREGLRIVAADPSVDMLLVLLTPQSSTEIEDTARAIAEVRSTSGKPVVAAFMGGTMVEPGARILNDAEVTVLPFPEEGAQALQKLVAYRHQQNQTDSLWPEFSGCDRENARALLARATAHGRKNIPEAEAIQILAAYGFPTLRSVVVTSKEDAERVGAEIQKPLAMKIVSDDVLHKSDAGGVLLNVDPKDAGTAYGTILANVKKSRPEAKLDGVLVVEMAPKGGVEVILGVTRDPALGHLIMVGLGGIYVEVLKDVAFGLAPVLPSDARSMVESLKTRKLFDGVRGNPALDTDALIDAIGRLSQLIDDMPTVSELDINPLLVLPKGQGVCALDARIIV